MEADRIKKHISDDWELDFNYVEKNISIILKRYISKFPSHTLFYIPLCKIEKMNSEIAELFMRFISFFMERQSFFYPDEHIDMVYLISSELEQEEEEEEEKKSTGYEAIRQSYEYGHISDILEMIKKADSDPAKIEYDLNHAICRTDNEQSLIQAMREGLPILTSDEICNYEEEDNEEHGIKFDLQRSFGLIWDLDDEFTEYMFDNINASSCELWVSTPVQYCNLSPTIDKIPELPDFPIKLTDWITGLINILDEYE